MLKDCREKFKEYARENFSENKRLVIKGVFKKLSMWEITNQKRLVDATKEELVELCKSGSYKIANRSYGALKTRIDAINEVLAWLNVDIKLSMTDFNTNEILVDNKTRYFTKEEIQDVCDLFINPQDKYIVYGIFCGIFGKAYSDLLQLKVSDINLSNQTITTPSGKTIKMDDYLLDIVSDTIDPIWGAKYYKYITTGKEGTTTSNYNLNMKSEYVLKPKPYSKNNDGTEPMKVNGIQRRLNKLSEVSDVTLSGIDIYRSGVMHMMYSKEIETGEKWTCALLEEWLKENNIKAQVFELYRLYNNKYHSKEKTV